MNPEIKSKRFILPNRFNHNNIEEFIRRASTVFELKYTRTDHIILESDTVSQISVVGVLLLYKFMEYVVKQKCCSSAEWKNNSLVKESVRKYGFTDLMSLLLSGGDLQKENKVLKKIEVTSNDKLIIAPQPLFRDKSNYTEKILREKYLPEVIKYYGNSEVSDVILMSITEILSNFYKHAIDDDQSILVAEGNKQKIEIACADTGNGIIRTIREGIPELGKLSVDAILQRAVSKGVTSKPGTHHMGRGLWLLDRIATLTKGKFYLFSQGASYKNNAGKIEVATCGNWEGTVVYLNLPLHNPVSIESVLSEEQAKLDQIGLNVL